MLVTTLIKYGKAQSSFRLHTTCNAIFYDFSRMAIKYIQHLQYLLSYPPQQKIPSYIVEFDPTNPAWIKAGNGLHPHLLTTPPSFDGHPPLVDLPMMDLDEEHSSDNVWMTSVAGPDEDDSPARSTRLISPESPPSSYWILFWLSKYIYRILKV